MPPAPPAPLVPPRPFILNELTWKTVRDARYEVAVLPWGATEAHNLHLPYSTDNVETERIAALAARHASERGARVVVLPVVPFGVNTGQLDIPLCLNLNPSTQALVLRDLATALAGQGVAKLVILNGHGGNGGERTEVRRGGEREDRELPGGAGAGRSRSAVRMRWQSSATPAL